MVRSYPVVRLKLYNLIAITLCSLCCLSGVGGLSCYQCNYPKQAEKCATENAGAVEQCKNTAAQTCMVLAGLRYINETKRWDLVMERRCPASEEIDKDDKEFKKMAKGSKILCVKHKRAIESSVFGQDIVDTRCVCAEEKCNGPSYDDIMNQPFLYAGYTDKDAPEKPEKGLYSLAKVKSIFNLTSSSSTDENVVTPHPSSGKEVESISTTATNDSSTVDTLPANSKPTESGGSNTGIIIGIAVGVVILAALIAGAVWYWRKGQFRKDSGPSGASGNSARTSAASEEDED